MSNSPEGTSSNSPEGNSLNCSFHIKDYIDAAHDAARGTRVVTIVLAVACVLVFIGFWNSFHNSWAHSRLVNAYDPDDKTIFKTLDIDKHPKLRSLSLFGPHDFKDPYGLARKLSEKKDPLSTYLSSQFRPEARTLLAESVKYENPTPEQTAALNDGLATEFNRIISGGKSLYDEKLFGGEALQGETGKLQASHPDGTELIRLNRLLLEGAYQDEIAKSYDMPLSIDGLPLIPAEAFRKDLQQQAVRAYVENVRLVRAPFFGIAFDINDLGLIGGIGFIVILLLLRHSLSREIKSLNRSFKEALDNGQLRHFYHVLAIRQVFTVPEMEGEIQNRLLALSQKIVSILPALVFSIAVAYDYSSVIRLGLYSWQAVSGQLLFEAILLLIIIYLSWRCLERLRTIDKVWEDYWKRLTPTNSRVVLLDKDLVEKYGRDTLVNDALRSLKSSDDAIPPPQP